MYMNRKGIVFGVKDTWDMGSTLSPIILAGLKKFKEVVTSPEHAMWRGIPGKLIMDLYPDLEGQMNEEQSAAADVEWLNILDKMIYAFDLNNEPELKDYNFKFSHRILERYEDGSSRITIEHSNEEEYQRYRADEAEHYKKVEEGHMLFGKYVDCLWW